MSVIQQPGVGGDKFEAAAHENQLCLFFPSEFQSQVPTVNGASDVITTRIVNLDTGQVLDDAKVWGKAMVPQLKGAVPDGVVLGRVVKGVAKGSNNAPWLISSHDQNELARGEAWIAQDVSSRVRQPQAQAAPPTGGGWNAPATQQGGWGQQAPAAPATGGWGNPPQSAPQGQWNAPAAPAQASSPGAGWGASSPATAAAPTAPAAPAPAPTATSNQLPDPWAGQAVSAIHPGLVAALTAAGFPPPAGATQEQAEQLAAQLGLKPGA